MDVVIGLSSPMTCDRLASRTYPQVDVTAVQSTIRGETTTKRFRFRSSSERVLDSQIKRVLDWVNSTAGQTVES